MKNIPREHYRAGYLVRMATVFPYRKAGDNQNLFGDPVRAISGSPARVIDVTQPGRGKYRVTRLLVEVEYAGDIWYAWIDPDNLTDTKPNPSRARSNPGSGVRIVHNRLLGGWFIVRGPHQTPLGGRFDSKEEARAHLQTPPHLRNLKKNPRRRADGRIGSEWFFGHPPGLGTRRVIARHYGKSIRAITEEIADDELHNLQRKADAGTLDDKQQALASALFISNIHTVKKNPRIHIKSAAKHSSVADRMKYWFSRRRGKARDALGQNYFQVQVKKGSAWIYLAGFQHGTAGKRLAKNYGKMLAGRFPRKTFRIFWPDSRMKKNPVAARDPRVLAAARRFKRFTGHDAESGREVAFPDNPGVGLAVGPVLMIGYETIRDGRREKYAHRFAAHARPLLAASHDGRTLYLLGGAYRFTDRGIVDSR